MATLVRDSVQVDTNVFTKAMNMVVNSVMQLLLEIVYMRKRDPAYLLGLRKLLEDSMYIWLHERTLNGVLLEVSLPDSSNALENWEVVFAYSDDPDSEVKRAPTEEIKRFGQTLRDLPAGSVYRILVNVKPGAKIVPGWSPATRKNINPTVEKQFGQFGYGNLAGQLRYTGGIVEE
jgi:hypothetical protein